MRGALSVNFRSREELLDVLNAAFAPELRGAVRAAAGRPQRAGPDGRRRRAAAVQPRPAGGAAGRAADHRHDRLGRARAAPRAWPAAATSRGAAPRPACSRTGCAREADAGRRAGDMVVLVRATASLRLLEEALEEQGLPTYVVGGRGYWSQEQVRDGLAWLRVLANPHDEEALLTVLVLAVPRRGHRRARPARPPPGGGPSGAAGDGSLLGRARRPRDVAAIAPAARRPSASTPSGAPLEVLLERAIVATGYDLAMLARPGGDRRLANLRKLMRLAGEYERAEGRDLRGFLADAAGPRPGARRARARRRSSPRAWTPCA